MSWNYKFIDHTADIAFDVEADNLNELFIASAYAWRESISDDRSLTENNEKSIKLEEDSLEILLVAFLSELNYLFQSESWLMNSIHSVQIIKEINNWHLRAKILGSNFNRNQMKLKAEIKAITYHQMEIKEEHGKFSTRIVFDI
jgi:SHS2 domain-containing protein